MDYVADFRCVKCEVTTNDRSIKLCPVCGDGVYDIEFDLDAVTGKKMSQRLSTRANTMWRYSELLPVPFGAEKPSNPLGFTPMFECQSLGIWCGLESMYVKDETRNPSASFKDRASAVAVTHAKSIGQSTLACASTGNAAGSLGSMCANMGLNAVIFLPENAPDPKVIKLLAYGAKVVKVRAGYTRAYELCNEACAQYGWYNRNCAINPYLIEGKKTCGLEIAEQSLMNPFDWIVVSVGDGCTIAGIWKGLWQMHRLGILPKLPKMLGVQACGVSPIVKAFEGDVFNKSEWRKKNNTVSAFLDGSAEKPRKCVITTPECADNGTSTLADSINVDSPRNSIKALKALDESAGAAISVSDNEILKALHQCAKLTGVFPEPAAAASVAGLKRAKEAGVISNNDRVLVVITGSGLNDIQNAGKAVGKAITIDVDLTELNELYCER